MKGQATSPELHGHTPPKDKLAKASALITDPAKHLFERVQAKLLAKWGVKPSQKHLCAGPKRLVQKRPS